MSNNGPGADHQENQENSEVEGNKSGDLQLPDELNDILREETDNEEEKNKFLKILSRFSSVTKVSQSSFQGPVPPPEVLKGYNEAVQNGGERLFQSFEQETEHRQSIEKNTNDHNLRQEKRGQWIALVITLICICSSVILGLYGAEIVASIIGGSTVISLAYVFVKSQQYQSDKGKNGN